GPSAPIVETHSPTSTFRSCKLWHVGSGPRFATEAAMAETTPPLTRAPDTTPDIPTFWLALGVTMFVAVFLAIWGSAKVPGTLGDTDDALRLVLVRDLLSGHAGWWDQHFTRLQPPLGMDLHWSRLVDGGLALLESGFRLFLQPAQAELATR